MSGAAVIGGNVAVPARRQVFVCGDLHNLGDLKLLLQNLALTGGRGGFVRYWAALPAPVVEQVEAAGGTLVPGRRLLAFARRCFGAEVVFGGGQLVRDNVSPASLVGLWLAAISARLGGGRFVSRGLGVSATASPLRRLLWRGILANCRCVNLRDEASARNLRSLLPRKGHRVNADMVFLPTAAAGVRHGEAERRWIVVAPCCDGTEARSIEGAALDAALAAAFRRLPDARLVIACHDPREGMDRAVARRLRARWPERDVEIMDGYRLDALTDLYGKAALVVTNRLHALIFSLLADAPVIAIEDGTAKVRVIADGFDVPVLARACDRAADGKVDRALAFDRAHRARTRLEMARRAAGNLA